MGLTNESPNPHTQTTEGYRATLAEMRARNLASRLVTYEHNPDPREAPNPAQGIRIRVLRPFRHLPVTQDVKDHNNLAASLGHPEIFGHLWGEHE